MLLLTEFEMGYRAWTAYNNTKRALYLQLFSGYLVNFVICVRAWIHLLLSLYVRTVSLQSRTQISDAQS